MKSPVIYLWQLGDDRCGATFIYVLGRAHMHLNGVLVLDVFKCKSNVMVWYTTCWERIIIVDDLIMVEHCSYDILMLWLFPYYYVMTGFLTPLLLCCFPLWWLYFEYIHLGWWRIDVGRFRRWTRETPPFSSFIISWK